MFEAWFDTLSGIEEEFDLKAENLAQYIKCLKAEVEVIDTETKNSGKDVTVEISVLSVLKYI